MKYVTEISVKVDVSQNEVLLDELSKLKHFKDSNTGLWAIDRDPKTASFEWIKDNCFQIGYSNLDVPERFNNTFHEIVNGLGTLFSSLGADSGIMAIVMSWGDTQDSKATLRMLNDYIERYVTPNN